MSKSHELMIRRQHCKIVTHLMADELSLRAGADQLAEVTDGIEVLLVQHVPLQATKPYPQHWRGHLKTLETQVLWKLRTLAISEECAHTIVIFLSQKDTLFYLRCAQ